MNVTGMICIYIQVRRFFTRLPPVNVECVQGINRLTGSYSHKSLPMDKNKVLIITGMHRSNASVITQWLRKCGLETGNDLPGMNEPDEYRHFEDVDFLDAHKAILKSHRLPDNGFTASPLNPLSYNERDRLKDIVFYKNQFNRQWGWKDPRTCLFLETYRQLIPDAFYLVVWRDYQSVVCSLINQVYRQAEKKYTARKGVTKFIWDRLVKKRQLKVLCKKHCQSFLKTWITYNQAILHHIGSLPENNYIITEHTALYKNDKPVFQYLTDSWGFALRFCSFKSVYKEMLLNKSFNIDACITDTTLISQAKHIENELLRLSVLNSRSHSLMAV